ncbi:MAG: GNAT family N-acetyltransferase [Chloroflexi bacterium]|nr:GNAT family N-acetyltransferase [Chloroflexota bacterium]
MVAGAVSKPNSNFKGIRPFDSSRDLFGVGQVLEEAFRPEGNFPLANVPFLRDAGIFLWTLGYAPLFPDRVSGFVFVQDGKIVGNITLTLDEGRLDRYFISNVAVRTAYRHRGIARELLQTAIKDLRAQKISWALLNVRPDNPEAIQLYEHLGFQQLEMNGEWILSQPSHRASRLAASQKKNVLRPLRSSDHFAVKELIRAATPANVLQFRAPRLLPFNLTWDDRVAEMATDFFLRQTTRRWGLEENGNLCALLSVIAQRGPLPHRLAIQVHPAQRGAIEKELIAFGLDELEKFPSRRIHATGTSTHPELIAALEENEFKFARGLTLMALAL